MVYAERVKDLMSDTMMRGSKFGVHKLLGCCEEPILENGHGRKIEVKEMRVKLE